MDSIRKILVQALIISGVFVLGLLGIKSYSDSKVQQALIRQEFSFKEELLDMKNRNSIKLSAVASSLQKKNLEIKETKDNEINNLNVAVIDLRRRLQQRPERPEDSQRDSNDSNRKDSTQQGCTGAGLYRNDGLFLAGYAQRAALAQIEYKFCVDKYNSLVDSLEDLKDLK